MGQARSALGVCGGAAATRMLVGVRGDRVAGSRQAGASRPGKGAAKH